MAQNRPSLARNRPTLTRIWTKSAKLGLGVAKSGPSSTKPGRMSTNMLEAEDPGPVRGLGLSIAVLPTKAPPRSRTLPGKLVAEEACEARRAATAATDAASIRLEPIEAKEVLASGGQEAQTSRARVQPRDGSPEPGGAPTQRPLTTKSRWRLGAWMTKLSPNPSHPPPPTDKPERFHQAPFQETLLHAVIKALQCLGRRRQCNPMDPQCVVDPPDAKALSSQRTGSWQMAIPWCIARSDIPGEPRSGLRGATPPDL